MLLRAAAAAPDSAPHLTPCRAPPATPYPTVPPVTPGLDLRNLRARSGGLFTLRRPPPRRSSASAAQAQARASDWRRRVRESAGTVPDCGRVRAAGDCPHPADSRRETKLFARPLDHSSLRIVCQRRRKSELPPASLHFTTELTLARMNQVLCPRTRPRRCVRSEAVFRERLPRLRTASQ